MAEMTNMITLPTISNEVGRWDIFMEAYLLFFFLKKWELIFDVPLFWLYFSPIKHFSFGINQGSSYGAWEFHYFSYKILRVNDGLVASFFYGFSSDVSFRMIFSDFRNSCLS